MEIFEPDRLPSLAEFLGELVGAAQVEPELGDVFGSPDAAQRNPGFGLAVSEIKADLPFELDLIEEQGAWQLDAAPPTQKIETSVMPVLHRLRIRVVLDDGERGLDTVES
jgi:hypothetical protein